MGRIAAIGSEVSVRGFGLAGVLVLPADGDDAARTTWRELPGDVELVILTPEAAAALAEQIGAGPPVVAVIPG